jgi:hypothetical protein
MLSVSSAFSASSLSSISASVSSASLVSESSSFWASVSTASLTSFSVLVSSSFLASVFCIAGMSFPHFWNN